MTAKKKPEPEVVEMPGERKGTLKAIGGSMSDIGITNSLTTLFGRSGILKIPMVR